MIGFFARHPTAANLLMLVFLAIGILSFPKLRRETFPDFSPGDVEVSIPYPGATAEEVEEAICLRVEDAVDGINYVEEIRAEAREGVGVVTLRMLSGGDIRTFLDDIQTEVDAIDDFPDDVERSIVRQLGREDLVFVLLVAAPAAPPQLKAYCEDLKQRMLQLPNVSLVEVTGFSEHQLRVELSPQALYKYGLSVADVADIIARQSVDLPAGSIQSDERDVLIRFVEQRRSPQELEDLVVIGAEQGAEVTISQLGRVVDVFDLDEDKVLLDGQRAGRLEIRKTKSQDALVVADAAKAFLQLERERTGGNVHLVVTQDSSTLVRDRLTMLVKNGWQGMILVFLTMWLFFSLRLSLWVSAGLPVSFLGAMYFMPEVGLTINMLTMVGMLLALGLLMDDAIVIAENIATHLRKGKSAMQAAIDGVSEVRVGVLASFATTVMVFGPLVSLEGDIGKVLRVVPMILILVLLVSLVEAFLILPAHLGHSLRSYDPDRVSPMRRRFDGLIEWLRERVVGRTVDKLVEWRYVTVGSVVGLLLAALGLMAGGVVKFQAFPELDGDVITARLILPQGTPLARTEQVVARLTGAADAVNLEFKPRQPDRADLIRSVSVEYNRNPDAYEAGPHVASVMVDLLAADVRDATVDEVIDSWRNEVGDVPDTLSLTYGEPSFGPAGRPIEVRFSGPDLPTLAAIAAEARDWFASFVGVQSLSHDLRAGKPEFRITLREGALGFGIDGSGVARQLRAAFHGVTADEIQVGSEGYEIDVRLAPEARSRISDLESFYVMLADGSRVPLESVGEAEAARGWARIARIDRRRTVTLRGDVDTRHTNTAQLLADFQREFVPTVLERPEYADVDVSIEGEKAEAQETQRSMMRALLIGLLGVFLLLSFQFRSYVEPLVVLIAIPFALIGVILGHLFLGLDISMPSMLGFVSLSGVVVNDSILLVEFIKKGRRAGDSIRDAATQASRQRFRAVLLTSLTTAAGLLPLLAERSLQAQVLIPLAVSIVSGILASTVLVLLVIPCLYSILGDFGLAATVQDEQAP